MIPLNSDSEVEDADTLQNLEAELSAAAPQVAGDQQLFQQGVATEPPTVHP